MFLQALFDHNNKTSLGVFTVIILALLAMDLGLFSRKPKTPSVKSSLLWSLFWFSLACLFAFGIYSTRGLDDAGAFFTAYLIEQSLSVDNLFVFLLIFNASRIPVAFQHRILFWGIIGALIMRALFIGVGVVLIAKFAWLTYVLGALLIYLGIKTATSADEEEAPNLDGVIRFVGRFIPFTTKLENNHFFTRENGRRVATPMFATLIMIELSDVIFAVDSVPAVLAVSRDPFIVYTSNVFAILGLRSIYFALAHVMKLFRFMSHGLSVILVFIGVKMLIHPWYVIPQSFALGFVVGMLAVTVVLSLILPKPADK